MARYRVLRPTFINGSLQEPGAIVEWSGRPGSTLEALDGSDVEIPEDWQTLNGLQRIALARHLGAPKSRISAAQADKHIEGVIAARSAKVEKPRPVVVDEAGE